MTEKVLNEDSVHLLKECDAGCKMATESMEQILKYVSDTDLREIVLRFNKDHIALGEEIHQVLNSAGEESKEPNIMAKAFSWMKSEMKMTYGENVHQAASLLTDGCNMGIKSLCEYQNQYTAADEKSTELCEKLKELETHMIEELQRFL